MRLSSIELQRYFMSDLSVTVNPAFDADQPFELDFEDLIAEPESFSKKEDGRLWMIKLRIKNTENKDRNTPYFFSIEMVGFFQVSEKVPDERVSEFVQINGASVLYGAAREQLRSCMTAGPFNPILLPSVCFLDATPEAEKPHTRPRKRRSPDATKKTPRKRIPSRKEET